jgi:hypothetical protein
MDLLPMTVKLLSACVLAEIAFYHNAIIGYDETYRWVGEHAQFEIGLNLISSQDPGFIDKADLNFQLSDDSPVYKELPEFKKIPFAAIGLYIDEYRTSVSK